MAKRHSWLQTTGWWAVHVSLRGPGSRAARQPEWLWCARWLDSACLCTSLLMDGRCHAQAVSLSFAPTRIRCLCAHGTAA
ncbi:hypothetical protein AAFF_G00081860 [Aldrovandia affinis]|uniref:Uncharacterized protein n=1 Tax=Aldrovandia affinis TaxID=143900 RepID=A0AAD7T3C3_9TELE|nr:hypothetical protein AAFF_G00081860 [Aldrovandia affinis]